MQAPRSKPMTIKNCRGRRYPRDTFLRASSFILLILFRLSTRYSRKSGQTLQRISRANLDREFEAEGFGQPRRSAPARTLVGRLRPARPGSVLDPPNEWAEGVL